MPSPGAVLTLSVVLGAGPCCTGCCSSSCAGHEVQTQQGGLPGEASCWRSARLAPASLLTPSCGQGTPQHLHCDVSLTYLTNTAPHLKQEISCALEKTQADSAVDRPALDARKGRVTLSLLPGAVLLAWRWCDAAFPFVCL